MVKVKKNKKLNADSVHAKKSNSGPSSSNPFGGAPKKINPFEVHINKEKFKILGRTCKHDKGLPGVSRAKAVQKRKQTLGKEFMQKNKTNEFKDRRIGRNSEVINDELINARFVAEKMAQFKKASRFNLNDDEVLTHRGQTLEEIEQFKDDRSDDEVEDADELDANFTEVTQFGGEESRLDRKAAIDEMIVETKRRKVEAAKEKDEIFELTSKLDSNYKDLISIVGKLSKPEDVVKPEPDDYDRALREMIFEPRGAVSDRLLTEEELARKEKERLEQLENERLARMRDEEDNSGQKPKHRSADDLDDGYFAGSDVDEPGTLAYDLNGDSLEKENGTAAEVEEESGAEELSGEGEDDESSEVEDEGESDGNEQGTDDEDDEDNLSDLKATDEESGAEEEQEKSTQNVTKKIVANQKKTETNGKLPFTIEMPSKYDELRNLLKQHSPEDQGTLVERIIKCNHPKLEHSNKEKINKLFAFLLQYLNDRFTDASTEDVATSFHILDKLNTHLYDLVHMNPEKASVCLLDVIQEKYTEYKRNNKVYPSVDTLVFLKLVSNLYSTSDYRHNVVTPCYVFISHVLSNARVRSRQDVATGLFLVTLLLEYSQSSRRFVPSAFNFLLGVIYLSLPKRSIETLKIVPPFMSTGPFNKLLAFAEKPSETPTEEDAFLKADDLVTTTISVDFKIRALNAALRLTKDAIDIVAENVGSNYLAEPFLPLMERVNLDVYPSFVAKSYEQAKTALTALAGKTLLKLAPPEKKPKALRLFEPRIEKVYDDKRRPKVSQAKEEKIKLIHKIRRETKGAVREIRRDTEFLQKIRLNQQIQSDRERKEKVKRIYLEASIQQGELNELSRKKKKM